MGRHSLREPVRPVEPVDQAPPDEPYGQPALALLTPPLGGLISWDAPGEVLGTSRRVSGDEPVEPELPRLPIQRRVTESMPLPTVSPPQPRVEHEPDRAEPPERVVATPVGSIRPVHRPATLPDVPLPRDVPVPGVTEAVPAEARSRLSNGPRLLLGAAEPATLAEHLSRHGELPKERFAGPEGADQLIDLVRRAGLRGRGGAGFPTARKMASVLESAGPRRRPVVVANGCEGDPTSGKDELLLHGAAHLVLDGVALAAHAVGADEAIVCVHRGSPALDAVERAIAERSGDPCTLHLVTTPTRYVASEASALVNFLTTGEARPTTSPPLPSERGVQGRPTLVDNVETLAQLALLARHGDEWFRARGTEDSPGTMLVTVDGAVHRPGVYEVDMGARVGQLIRMAGGSTGRPQAMLLGGLGGSWLPLPAAGNLALAHQECRDAGVGLGVASVVVLPTDGCGIGVTSRLLAYLAGESAGQCGPCMFGLPALAEDFAVLTEGKAGPEVVERLWRRAGVIERRGACAHPDGAVRLATSALRVFSEDIAAHLDGQPCGPPAQQGFPLLDELVGGAEAGWR